MKTYYKKTKVNYKLFGNGKNLIVLLHGWGANISLMEELGKNIIGDFTYLYIDFPPFGQSEKPKESWNLDDYSNLTEKIILNAKKILQKEGIKINSIIVIGHSFGGRVAIKLCQTKLKINKLILLSSAGIKPKFSVVTKYKILKYKIYKRLKIKKAENLGSKDYKELDDKLKYTFRNIINEDLSNICKTIQVETLIIFGKLDKDTPLYMGKKLNKYIKNSKLIVIKNGGHFNYIFNMQEVLTNIMYFLNL